jgi:predicted dehydrogenase
VLTNLIHDIDTLRFVCGEIESLQAVVTNGARGLPINDTAAVVLRFVDGAVGTISMSDAVAAPWAWDLTSGENPFFGRNTENCYLLAGTEGALAVPQLKLWHYGAESGWGAALSTELVPFEPGDPYVRQLGHFVAVILGEEQPISTGADATRTLAATLAVERAAAGGSIITLSPTPAPPPRVTPEGSLV